MAEFNTKPISLGAVPETLLWTLYNRVAEARRSDTVLADPVAVSLMDRLDFPFAERFGRPRWSQAQALRAGCFDNAVRTFLLAHPGGTVVALGEGLETQFYRVDNGRVHWVSVDLPEVIALRERFLPRNERMRPVAAPVLEDAWLKTLGEGPVCLTAQGLFMYLPLAQVRALLARCAKRLPTGVIIFDAVPRWLSESTARGRSSEGGYVAPHMLWGMDAGELVTQGVLSPHGSVATELKPPKGRTCPSGIVVHTGSQRYAAPVLPLVDHTGEFQAGIESSAHIRELQAGDWILT